MENKKSDHTYSSLLDPGLDAHDLRVYINNILANVPGNLYWKNKKGVYLGCNRTMVETSRLHAETDIIGKTDFELWPDQALTIYQNDQEVLTSGQTLKSEEKVTIHSGEVLYFTSVKAPLRDEHSDIIGIIGNSLNITELKYTQFSLQKAKEQAEASIKAKSSFLANVSHDFITHLSIILNGIDAISHECNAHHEYERDIKLATNNLLDYVQDILIIAKAEYEKLPLKLEVVNLRDVFSEMHVLFKRQAEAKGIRFDIIYPDDR